MGKGMTIRIPETPGRMLQALREGDIDIFDALEAAPKLAENNKALWEMRRYKRFMEKLREAKK